MKHEIVAMPPRGGGVIANTASLAGIRVLDKESPAFHAAKVGLVQLSRKAAVDCATTADGPHDDHSRRSSAQRSDERSPGVFGDDARPGRICDQPASHGNEIEIAALEHLN